MFGKVFSDHMLEIDWDYKNVRKEGVGGEGGGGFGSLWSKEGNEERPHKGHDCHDVQEAYVHLIYKFSFPLFTVLPIFRACRAGILRSSAPTTLCPSPPLLRSCTTPWNVSKG